MRIIAVIVTYNRPEKLEKSIRAIYDGQVTPYELVVVNNFSTDETGSLLNRLQREFETLKVFETRKNLGGAGGFFVGLKAAYDRGATHFWIMDDDAYCQRTALSQLVSTCEELTKIEDIGFLCSRVNWTDGQICEMNQPEAAWDWMRRFDESRLLVKVMSCSFVACFFSREVLNQVGLPIKEFFIWFDDQEFTHRISKLYPCYAVMNSIVTHDIPRNQGTYYAEITNETIWKFRHGAANESWFRMWRKSPFHWLLFVAQKNWDMHRGRVSVNNRVRVNLAILSGMFRRYRVTGVEDCKLDDYIR
ncbi:MAG: glycosyltransferase [Xanthomonadales bacterium]|nr:glycosyltransferase [Xanthomonadales bacterium]